MRIKKEMYDKYYKAVQINGRKRLNLQCVISQTMSMSESMYGNTNTPVYTIFVYSPKFKEHFCTNKYFISESASGNLINNVAIRQNIPDVEVRRFYISSLLVKLGHGEYSYAHLQKQRAMMK